jgi:hypothetical protein
MYRWKRAVIGVAVAVMVGSAAVLVGPTPAFAATCVKKDHTMVARSILFGSDLAKMITHVEHCYDGYRVVAVNKYAATELIAIDPLVTVTFSAGGDPASGYVDPYDVGRFTVGAVVATGISVGGQTVGTSCNMTYLGRFYRDGTHEHGELNNCTPFWQFGGGRKTRLTGAANLVPYYYVPLEIVWVDIIDDPLPDGYGEVKITFPPSDEPGCDEDGCDVYVTLEGEPGDVADPWVRSSLHDIASTVPN